MISEALKTALAAHQRGDLASARYLYEEILKVAPDVADAWNLLGLIDMAEQKWTSAQQRIAKAIELDETKASFHYHLGEAQRCAGERAAAEASCRRALALEPQLAVAHNLLGMLQNDAARRPLAIASFRQALRYDPDLVQTYCNLASALQASDDSAKAEECLHHAIQLDRHFAPAWEGLGNLLTELGRRQEAIAAYREALALNPSFTMSELNLAALLHAQGKLDEAITHYERLLARAPHLAQAHCNLGSAYKDQGQIDRAVGCYQRALVLDPHLAEAHFNLGVILQRGNELAAARACYEAAIAARGDYAHAFNNLGTIHKMEQRPAEAAACYERALQIEPNFAEAINNLGNLYKLEGRDALALDYYERALASHPDYAQARYNRALALLTLGDFETGWREYEWRLKCPDVPVSQRSEPTWDGSPLGDRRLLVHAEQGLGDTLQFARYVKLLQAQGASLVFEVFAPLLPLLKQSGFADLAELGTASGTFDLQIPLLSMPRALDTRLTAVPADVPYLAADPRLVEVWRERLRTLAGIKLGIAWQGSVKFASDYLRATPLASFQPLAGAGVNLVSLQKGAGSEQLAKLSGRFAVHDLGEQLDVEHGPFMDTAAVMQCLDLVVTCDTAIAHLAGGLGVPVWLALPMAAEWRWLRNRADSPWYPTMRLFRQTTAGDWSTVFEPMAAELKSLVDSRNASAKR